MHAFKTQIETERTILRPFTMDDVEGSYRMNLDPEVTRHTHDGGVRTRSEIHDRIKGVIEGDYVKYGFGRFAVIDKVTNEFIGFSGLKYLPEFDLVDIGYRFMQSYWGKGLATETARATLPFGFDNLKLDKIYGFAVAENPASIRVMEKLGFEFDGTMDYDGIEANQYVLEAKKFRGL